MPSSAEQKRLLVLMAKLPEPGNTKTRLSPPLTAPEAAALYTCFLEDKLSTMRMIETAQAAIAYRPHTAEGFFKKLAPDVLPIPQMGKNLAQSLLNIFRVSFEMGFEQVLAIDGDTPDLPASYLHEAFEALDDHRIDIVMGPTEDGGYYAIGMRSLHPMLFDVEMSTASVYHDTRARAEGAGLRVSSLPHWYDVDRPTDLERLRHTLASGLAERAPVTAAYLEGLT